MGYTYQHCKKHDDPLACPQADEFLCYLLLLDIACFVEILGDLLVGLLELDVRHSSI